MKVENLVPTIYYKESRDFSYIGRLFEVLLNYMKTNADLVDASLNSDSVKSILVELLNSTLGFESKHEYITKDLIYIASSFTELVRKKGSEQAISEAIQLLLTSQNIDLAYNLKINQAKFEINIIVPTNMNDVVLLEDLFDYIIPAGWTVVINKGDPNETSAYNVITSKDSITSYIVNDSGDNNGLGNVYFEPRNTIDAPEYEFEPPDDGLEGDGT